jgi:hypothetical protein
MIRVMKAAGEGSERREEPEEEGPEAAHRAGRGISLRRQTLITSSCALQS